MSIQNTNLLNQHIPPQGRISQPVSTQGTPAVAAALPAVQTPSPEQLKQAVNTINQVLRQASRNLEFSVDNETNRVVVKVMDTETGQLIRQIPSEETLAISREIGKFQQGLLLKQKA